MNMRTVVVGSSSGLGRSIALGLAERGNRVAMLARRRDRLEAAAKEAGNDALAVACDVTDASSCRAAIEEAAAAMSGIDALVYAPGVGLLRPIADIDADSWRRLFGTNVIGASLMTAAVVPHLTASGGVAAYLSSVSASLTPPWPGLGGYLVSKAALDKLVEAWRAEHPSVGFTRIVVGETLGGEGHSASEFANDWDMGLAGEFMPVWMAKGYMSGALLDVSELVHTVDAVFRTGRTATIHTVTVAPRPP